MAWRTIATRARAWPWTMVIPVLMMRPAPRWRTTAPAAAIQLPAMRTLTPDRLGIDVTGALAHPLAFAPEMTITVPVPVARHPDETMAWRRQRFSARRRRCADVDVDRHLRLSNGSEGRCSTERYETGEYYFFHHLRKPSGEDMRQTTTTPAQFQAAQAGHGAISFPWRS